MLGSTVQSKGEREISCLVSWRDTEEKSGRQRTHENVEIPFGSGLDGQDQGLRTSEGCLEVKPERFGRVDINVFQYRKDTEYFLGRDVEEEQWLE